MSEPSLHTVLDALGAAVVVLDARGAIVTTNDAWRRQARSRGVSAAASGTGVSYLRAHQAVCGGAARTAESVWTSVRAVLKGNVSFETSYPCMFPTGTRHFYMSVTPLAGERRGALVTHTDVTERRRYEAELLGRANHDPLTGLPNRYAFFQEADKALALAKRRQHVFALLYLDLDGFKAVNDANGHEVGDEVLCRVAERLRELLREGDLMARLGGDEFIALFQANERSSVTAAKRYQRSLEQPFKLSRHTVALRGSFGLAHYPSHAQTLTELVRCADSAMYRAKAAGGGIEVYA